MGRHEDRTAMAGFLHVSRHPGGAPGIQGETMQDRIPPFPEKRCTVLLVDDARDSREMYAFFLRGWGYGVHEATDGGDAVAMAVEMRPDVIVMDLHLPMVDGYAAIGALAAHPETARIPVVVLSAHTFPEDERRAQEAGAAAFLGKPCHPDLLARTVRAVSGTCDEAMAAHIPFPAPGPAAPVPLA
jgi:CheY-like chemotaxis protein